MQFLSRMACITGRVMCTQREREALSCFLACQVVEKSRPLHSGRKGRRGRRGGGEEGRRSLHVLCKDCAAVLKAALTQDPGTAQGLVPVHKLTASFAL